MDTYRAYMAGAMSVLTGESDETIGAFHDSADCALGYEPDSSTEEQWIDGRRVATAFLFRLVAGEDTTVM
jgi:hypothetical protein